MAVKSPGRLNALLMDLERNQSPAQADFLPDRVGNFRDHAMLANITAHVMQDWRRQASAVT